MKKAIIHIGYPKAASTWLQKNVFPTVRNATPVIKNPQTKYFIETYQTEFSPEEAIRILPDDDTLLLSDERFLGGMLTGGMNGFAIKCIAERFKTTFDKVKIVIVVRNQYDIIASTYSHYVYYGGTYNFEKFYLNNLYYVIQKMALFSPHLFDYYRIYDTYTSLFGKDNVAVLLYEDIELSPIRFISQIENKTDLLFDKHEINLNKINESKSYKDIQIQRFINRFTKYHTIYKHYFFNLKFKPDATSFKLFRKEGNRVEKILGKKFANVIKTTFNKSNELFFKEIGLDKNKYQMYP